MKYFPLAASLVILGSSAAYAGPNGECTCRYKGGDVAEGKTVCMQTAKGSTLARCDRVLNNTSWKFLDEPCPTAELRTPLERVDTAG